MSITAPYNFVPLSEQVFYPFWNDKISHDIPFEDGESGEIDIVIDTKSPIFIRNHEVDNSNENSFYIDKEGKKISKEFCHVKTLDGSKQYYIPGSSMKGMIRNILEIMSFSKIKVDEEKLKKPLGIRDMKNRQLVGAATGKLTNENFGYGILYIKNDGSYSFDDYGNKIRVILQTELESNDARTLPEELKPYKNISRNKDVSKKYNKVKAFTKLKVTKLEIQDKQYFDKCPVILDENGEDGELFFGGHFGRKHYEFVLLHSDKKERDLTIPKISVANFKHIYFENRDKDNYVGNYWRDKKKIPVFYTINGKKIDLGLTQIFKLSYNKTLFEASRQNSDDKELDLAETIFGTQREGIALKGRVQFSHLKASDVEIDKKNEVEVEVEQVLGMPNPTYYPNYIQQKNINGNKVTSYNTLMDSDVKISGWKIYPLQNQIQKYELPTKNDGKINHDVTSKFIPLKSAKFSGKLRFHNLKKAEIGALLSALTFHKQGNKYLHNIGMAKPLGYGKISITLSDFKYFDKLKEVNIEEYLKSFEKEMNNWKDKKYKNWSESNQIKELFSMHNETKAKSIKYQQLKNEHGKNDFVEDKKQNRYLIPHSQNKDNKKTQIREYTITEIATEVNVSPQEVLNFILTSSLPISKRLDINSKLKEAQAKGLINKMKKSS